MLKTVGKLWLGVGLPFLLHFFLGSPSVNPRMSMVGLSRSFLLQSPSLLGTYNHRNRKIGVVFGYSRSHYTDRSVSVVVGCVAGPVDFCAIALFIELLLLRDFSKNCWKIEQYNLKQADKTDWLHTEKKIIVKAIKYTNICIS